LCWETALHGSALETALPLWQTADCRCLVLENAKSSAGGHRLGVNGLAVDTDNAIL
jgi:hypothetical protein